MGLRFGIEGDNRARVRPRQYTALWFAISSHPNQRRVEHVTQQIKVYILDGMITIH